MKLATCPTPETLHDMLLGKSAAAELEALSEHLAACSRCAALAAAGTAEDELIASMRIATSVGGDTKELNDAIKRAYTIHSESETMQSSETVALGDSAATADEDSLSFDFLGPAQQADELGRLGGYRVIELIGVGGMGMVFRAEDLGLKREVALKVMMPHVAAAASARERFLREAQAAAAIDHDNVVQIFQVGEDRNVPFIAMQYLKGESLHARQRRGETWSQAEVLRIGREVAAGLAAAHSKGLIHRDIKPDNIWLEAGRDRAKILDFGLARSHEQDGGLTHTGVVLGTPKYMSPEQAKGETADHRSDLFSLGSVLYYLAAGKPPFRGKNLTSILLAVSQARTEKIEKVVSELQPDLAALINQLLAKQPQDRPQSAKEVVTKLAGIEAKMADATLGETLNDHSAVQPDAIQVAAQAKSKSRQKPKRIKTSTPQADLAARMEAEKGRARRRVFVLVAAGVLGVLAMLAAPTIFRINAGEGTLVLKVTGDDFETALRGKTVEIRNAKTNAEYTIDLSKPTAKQPLEPGDYRFVLTDNSGLKTTTDRFTITSGDDQVVEVYWESQPMRVAEMNPEPSVAAAVASAPATSTVPMADVEIPSVLTERSVAEYLLNKGAQVYLRNGGSPVDQLPAGDDWHAHVVRLGPDVKMTDEDMRLLKYLSKIEVLIVACTGITGAAYSELQPLNLKELDIQGGTFSNIDLDFLRGRTLEELSIHDPVDSFPVEACEAIANMKSLQRLTMIATELSLEQFRRVTSVPELSDLILYGTHLQNQHVDILVERKGLRLLDISHSGLPAEQISRLAVLPQLESLMLWDEYTDEEIASLYRFKQLESLDLRDSKLSPEAFRKLKKALPNCHIQWKYAADAMANGK